MVLDNVLTNQNEYITENDNTKFAKLKLDKNIPRIVLPFSKHNMFIQWWDSDIRFEKSIPHSFERGYLILDGFDKYMSDNYTNLYNRLIKERAKQCNFTFRYVENEYITYLDRISNMTMYYIFTKENEIIAELYGKDNVILAKSEFTFGVSSHYENPIINIDDFFSGKAYPIENFDDSQALVLWFSIVLLVTSLWYVATNTSNKTRYIYDIETPVITSRHKNIVNVSDTKTIKTPIYDLRQIKTVKVEKLQQRKKGWTYSHSFQVCGHYRHYKNGKVIFIKSYTKGKEKDFKSQTIILNPE